MGRPRRSSPSGGTQRNGRSPSRRGLTRSTSPKSAQALHVQLMELESLLAGPQSREAAITAAVLRRLHSATVVALETQVDVIVQKLVALKVEVDTAHTQALAPDSLVEACRTALATLGTRTERVPTITWRKWSLAQSKSAKGAWTGDPFACPELVRAGLGVGITTGSSGADV